MPGHDRSSRRVRTRAWPRLILAAWLTSGAPVPARGQDPAGAGPPAAAPRAREPIDLAAHRVVTWTRNGSRWVLLSGRAAVLQGVEGLRAREAVVRVVDEPGPAGTAHRLDVYAEGASGPASDPEGRRPVRLELRTSAGVRLTPYQKTGFAPSDGPPRGTPIVARAARAFDPLTNPAAPGKSYAALKPPSPGTSPPEAASDPGPPPGPVGAPVFLPDRVPSSGPSDAPREVPPPVGAVPIAGNAPAPKVGAEVRPAQAVGGAEDGPATEAPGDGLPPLIDSPDPADVPAAPALPDVPGRGGGDPAQGQPNSAPAPSGPSTDLAPLPAPGSETVEAPPGGAQERPEVKEEELPQNPLMPGTQRITRIYPGGSQSTYQRLPMANGVDTYVFRGGWNVVTEAPNLGIVDLSADNIVLWRTVDAKGRSFAAGPNGEQIDSPRQPLEVYLEGNVVFRQDERKVAGNGDQRTYRAKSAYFNFLNNRSIVLDAELDMFAPGLIAPARLISPRIEQYSPLVRGPDGRFMPGDPLIRADKTMTTGSRFPNPGYQFNSRSVDVFRVRQALTDPNSGRAAGDRSDPNAPDDLVWRLDARQNIFWLGYVPAFYWPRLAMDADDLESPIREVSFRTNNYFGQQVLSDWNGFRLFGLRRPVNIDMWNVDLDYLSARTKRFPALGSEIGWFGNDLINDLADPYHKLKGQVPSWTKDYFGYFDIWGLRDYNNDVLGSGPAIITNNIAAGKAGYQRGGGGPKGSVPPFQNFRGRMVGRHMQRFLPDDDEHVYEDLRAQIEVGYISDRHFLEEYYKRLFDVGMDQETLFYLIRSKQDWAYSIWTEANLQNWYTDTQWLPRFDYYRLGDSLLGDRLTYFTHSGADYASVHTAVEVNNPNIFAFLPYDPISNTSQPTWTSGRGYTNHELDFKLNLGNVLRVVPYVQGQAVGWTQQIDGRETGRLWGGAGVRAEVVAWKAYPWVNSELLNVHGLNHKINFEADYRDSWSNMKLNETGVQDDLDDNTYEFVRRYFALTNYAGGVLPQQFDPRHLILRRMVSPISGPTDVQASLNALHLGIHQRLQTKRGPEGKRRIIDYMTFDLDTTYFPYAQRDNFGKAFGQNMYNWQWFIGDRTSIMSYGWFEFWKLNGQPIYNTNINRHNDPFGLNIITTGISLSRPPRGNVFIGYSVVDTGPINTSALTTSVNYWMSPKWYGTYSTMYDFGNAILLNAAFSLTRVGADYLTSLGLTVDPQRQSYMFAFVVSPRLSPNIQLGNGVGLSNLDTRYAPTQ